MLNPHPTPEVGQLVTVRNRPFVVTDVRKQGTPTNAQALSLPQHLLKLSSVEDDGMGEELEVIWELEPGRSIKDQSTLPEVTGFDPPGHLEAFLDAVRWGAVSQADDKALQSPFRSGIDIEDYQLDPVVRALTMPRVNLLIADDVGLGKTVEAGLVVQEMILRHRARTVLIVCPSSLQVQWQEEMRDKFGLEFRIIDRDTIGQLRRKRGIHVNPWSHFPRLITSIDYLKRERPLRLFKETLPGGGQVTYPRPYDLLIVDEAHNVAPSGRGKYATDSQRTSAIRELTPHFEHKLFLSATPHNGYQESFTALLELLDNQRFARAVTPDRKQLEAVMVRRMKSELEQKWDGTPRFARREVLHLEVPYTKEEQQAHQDLQRYTELRRKKAATEGDKYVVEFVLKLLKKRLFSSPAAFASTLDQHLKTLRNKAGSGNARNAQRQLLDLDDDYRDDEEFEEAQQDAVTGATALFSPLDPEEEGLLANLQAYVEKAVYRADSKAEKLIQWLEHNLKPGGNWNDKRVILFTEYRATQKWLSDLLAHRSLAGEGRLATIYGGMPGEDREKIKAAFQAHPKDSPVRILLATDAASEGLNLQNHCSELIHIEIPWNPNRMEQRNGRIDRHGQKAKEVHIHHFVGQGFDLKRDPTLTKVGDLGGDLEFLMRAALKINQIREDLGKVGPVIAAQVEDAMLGRRKTLDTKEAEEQNQSVKRMLSFERRLKEQLEKLVQQLDETKEELHLSPENIENVVRVGLELAKQPPLRPTELSGIWPDPYGIGQKSPVFEVPALSGSWAHALTGLEHPHTKKKRPIVFDPALAQGRDDVVIAHLNHRLVQMCLRLLRAELWSAGHTKRLHRVTACVVDDRLLSEPTVIAQGRIVVLGGDNHRLHEEVIQAGGVFRQGRFNRLNVGETKRAFDALSDVPVPEAVQRRLMEMWPDHQAALNQSLNVRKDERTKNLEKTLQERVEKEVGKIQTVLTELEKNILSELKVLDNNQQMLFGWLDEERNQLESNKSALKRRLEEIPIEREQEAKNLRARFTDPQARLFPIAVTYLIPRKSIRDLTGGPL